MKRRDFVAGLMIASAMLPPGHETGVLQFSRPDNRHSDRQSALGPLRTSTVKSSFQLQPVGEDEADRFGSLRRT